MMGISTVGQQQEVTDTIEARALTDHISKCAQINTHIYKLDVYKE